MADVRINALATTATTSASDDFMALDGTTNGTRKMSAATPKFLTSLTVPTVASAAGADLNLSVGTAASGITILNGTTDATSSIAAAVTMAGGLAVAKKINIGTDAAVGGNLTVAGTGASTFAGNVTIAKAGALTAVTFGAGDAGGYSTLTMRGNNTQNAWQIASNNFTSNALEFTPSTAGGGTTFTTPQLTLTTTGGTIAGNLTVSGTGSQTIGGVASRLVLQGGTADTPASAAASGTAGSVVWDASYLYVAVGANTWKRVAIATW